MAGELKGIAWEIEAAPETELKGIAWEIEPVESSALQGIAWEIEDLEPRQGIKIYKDNYGQNN